MAERIGAVVITRNEAENIETCLESVAFCDYRIVVDSFSDDDTVERACGLADLVVRRDFVDHAEQKNWAADQLDTEWVLMLDADERVTPELADEIRRCVDFGSRDGWWIRRRNWFFGRFIRGAGWDRDRVLRLYRRNRGRYDERAVHEEVVMQPGASVGVCENRLSHFTYVDWPSTFERFLNYSRGGASDRRRRGKRSSAQAVVARPAGRFFRQYFLDRGWRDGLHGLVLCQWAAAGVFLRETRLLVEVDGDEDVNRGPGRMPRVECAKGQLRSASGGDTEAAAPTEE
jgi:glycosyltransferase involved in cell wall biosynthesis